MEIIGLTFAKWLWKMSDSKELGRGPFLTSGSLLAPGWGALLLRRRCIWIPWSWGVSGTWCVVKIISFPPSEKRPDLWICTVSTQGCNPSFLTLLPPVCDSYGAILFIRVFFFFFQKKHPIKINRVQTCWLTIISKPDSDLQQPTVVLVARLRLFLCYPMDCTPPGSFVHGILQARIPEWVAVPSSRGIFPTCNQTRVSCTADRLYHLSH